jgi:hypothetical protein
MNTCKVHVAGGGKRPCVGIVKLCVLGTAEGRGAPTGEQDLAVLQQRRGCPVPGGGHCPGGTEGTRSGIVNFGAGEDVRQARHGVRVVSSSY